MIGLFRPYIFDGWRYFEEVAEKCDYPGDEIGVDGYADVFFERG